MYGKLTEPLSGKPSRCRPSATKLSASCLTLAPVLLPPLPALSEGADGWRPVPLTTGNGRATEGAELAGSRRLGHPSLSHPSRQAASCGGLRRPCSRFPLPQLISLRLLPTAAWLLRAHIDTQGLQWCMAASIEAKDAFEYCQMGLEAGGAGRLDTHGACTAFRALRSSVPSTSRLAASINKLRQNTIRALNKRLPNAARNFQSHLQGRHQEGRHDLPL